MDGKLIICPDTSAFQFAIPFTWQGEMYPSGSWIVVFKDENNAQQRFPLNAQQFRDYMSDLGAHATCQDDLMKTV